MAEVFNSQFSCEEIEEILSNAKGSALISQEEDDTYVMKQVDAEGNLLVGFKLNGEIEVPIGLTDDAYTLIESLYEKLIKIVPSIKKYCEDTYEKPDVRRELIDGTDDDTHVVKVLDANGEFLQGIKTNGEMDAPIGLSDDSYLLHQHTFQKLDEMAAYIRGLVTRIENLENNN